MRVLLIDCSTAGISGDMLLASLIDLGASPKIVKDHLEKLPKYCDYCSSLTFSVDKVNRGSFVAARVRLECIQSMSAVEGSRLLETYDRAAKGFNLSEKARDTGERALRTLVATEAKLHGETVDDVHLHEAGSVDTLCDILGTCVALEELDLLSDVKILGTNVALGAGAVSFSHGAVPVPPPATLEILRSACYPFHGVDVNMELATPTGVALLTSLVQQTVSHYPPMWAKRVGYGAGNADSPKLPNVLRVVEGDLLENESRDEVSVLETLVDDMPGEILGYTTEKLLREGARDAHVIPAFGKKNRPAFLIQVISDHAKVDELVRILFEETGTLGVRVNLSHRRLAVREIVSINAFIKEQPFSVRIKVSTDSSGKLLGFKPEFEDLSEIAKTTGLALREISEQVREQAKPVLAQRFDTK